MKLRFYLLCFILFWLYLPMVSDAKSLKDDSVRVLFIGNSFTYYHDMPKMVKSLADSIDETDKMKLSIKMMAPGGWSFEKHLGSKEEMDVVKKGCWNYVVLQEQSAKPCYPTQRVVADTYHYAHIIDSIVKRYNPQAKVIFYMTWGHKNGCQEPLKGYPLIDSYLGMQQRLITSYLEMAYANDDMCAPVGMAWKKVRTDRQDLNLYWPDGSHPSELGSYLAANVIFCTILQKPYSSTFLGKQEASTAIYLQLLAQQTVLSSRKLLNLK